MTNAETRAALITARTLATDALELERETASRASAGALHLKVCKAYISTLNKNRANAIATNKPNAVIDIDGKFPRARVAVEIAAAKWETLSAEHTAAVTALESAKAEVDQCARAQRKLERIALAEKVIAASDTLLALGAQLQDFSPHNFLTTPLNVSEEVPVEVTRALERLPKPNQLDIPLNVLRSGGVQGGDGSWEKRFAELTADNVTIDVEVAA